MTSGNILVLLENEPVPTDGRVWWECQVLTEAGFKVTVVCPQGSRPHDTAEFEWLGGVAIHRYPGSVGADGALGHLTEYARAAWHIGRLVRRLARRERFDIVHANNPPDFLLLIALPLKARGARFIFDHHDLSPEMYRDLYGNRFKILYGATHVLEKMTFRIADAVISTNESYRRIALERGGKDPADVFVVRNAPDLARFRPQPPDPTLRKGATHLLGYVGVIGRQDGVDHALRALAALRRRRRDWRAIFLGSGPALGEMRSWAHRLGLDDVVEFTGYVPDEDVVRVLASSDVCLSPEPVTEFNNLSSWTKLGEYMAMGKPIVCFDLAESRLTAREAACYARPGDDEDYAASISGLLDDAGRRATMGATGRARVLGPLSQERSRQELLSAYERVLAQGRPAGLPELADG